MKRETWMLLVTSIWAVAAIVYWAVKAGEATLIPPPQQVDDNEGAILPRAMYPTGGIYIGSGLVIAP